MNALLNAPCNADAVYIDSDGLVPIALPETNVNKVDQCSDTGVSTRNVPDQNTLPRTLSSKLKIKTKDPFNWYALRTTYGREKNAYDFLISDGVQAFLPTMMVEKAVYGKKQLVEVFRLPKFYFLWFRAEDEGLCLCQWPPSYLRSYYKHIHKGAKIIKEPLIVPDRQIKSLQILFQEEAEDIRFCTR